MTARRDTVRAALDDASDGWHSAQDVHAALRAGGERVGLTTVYRHLQQLSDDGAVDVRRTDDGELVYRRCRTDAHHHHLLCRDCGRTVEVAGPAVERWAERVAGEHGFSDVSHTVEVVGRCAACSTS